MNKWEKKQSILLFTNCAYTALAVTRNAWHLLSCNLKWKIENKLQTISYNMLRVLICINQKFTLQVILSDDQYF